MNKEDLLSKEDFEKAADQAIDEGRKVFLIFEDKDGNYRGLMHKNGPVVQGRAGDPDTVLTELITAGDF